MKPIKFKGMNITYAKGQKPYLPLPAFNHDDSWESVTACWGMTFWERIKVLFTGEIWVTLPTFGKPLTPSKLEVDRPYMEGRE